MLRRLLVLASVVVIGPAAAYAQPAREADLLACKIPPGATMEILEERRQRLEREAGVETAARPAKAEAGGEQRKAREELLEVLFQIDCLNAKLKAQLLTRRFGQAPEGVIEITTYYATNRKQTAATEPRRIYSAEVADALQYGRAIVSIPPTHTPGNLELPSLWKLEREADPSKHFVLKSVVPLNADAGRREITERLQDMASKSMLIFVHGFNMGFAEAALRTAQIAHDLSFPGMAFFFSWPSANQIRAYWQDEEIARLSESVFEQLIEELTQLPVTDIYVVAHSMGNRVVGHALQARMDKGKETKKLRELLLAAPDINADVFRTLIAPRLVAMQGTRTTIYASSSDIALRASKVVHGYKRVGDTLGGVVTFPGMETIDASSAAAAIRGYGHFYLVDSPSVIKDIRSLIEREASASLRGLREVGAPPTSYWRLP
jgi:esterase/lipase superfamily enzyme